MRKFNIVLCIIVFCGLSFYRYSVLNTKYPSPQYYQARLNQSVEFSDCNIIVNDYYFLDQQSVDKLFTNEIQAGQKVLSIILDVNFLNQSKETKNIDISSLILTSSSWKNAIHLMSYLELNEPLGITSTNIILDAQESISLKLPFCINSAQFRDFKDWEKSISQEYELIVSLYPLKNTVLLKT